MSAESAERQTPTFRDLVEEAKKRIVIFGICIVGLSYLMSLTSSSVWVNLPVAASLILFFRYLAMDIEMRRKAAIYNNKSNSGNVVAQNKTVGDPKSVIKKPNWRRKVNSPVVEDAIDKFTRHLISEWVTDLWYSRLTPDKEGPDKLAQIINGAIGEISDRMRSINLIDLLTRDVIHLVCNHLELFRACQAKIEKEKLGSLTFEQRDLELRLILAAENKLHPALFSAESEHKVLQHLMDGLISLTFRPEDLQCSFFHHLTRELLACAVLRPVLNLASPRFINERIEALVISVRNSNRGTATARDTSPPRQNGPNKISPDHFSRVLDPSVTGVELVQLKNSQSKNIRDNPVGENENGKHLSKDPLLSTNTGSTRSWGPANSGLSPKGEWGDMLDYFSHRKTQALTPENFENMWTKGRRYRKKEAQIDDQGLQRSSAKTLNMANSSNLVLEQKGKDSASYLNLQKDRTSMDRVASLKGGSVLSGSDARARTQTPYNLTGITSARPPGSSVHEDDEYSFMASEIESESSVHFSSDGESSATGLDTPTTKVWDGRNNRNTGVVHIRHPLESRDRKRSRRANKQHERVPKLQSAGQVPRVGGQKMPLWQEVERTSFYSGDGQDILNPSKHDVKEDDSSDEYDFDITGRVHSGVGASSSPYSESLAFSSKSTQSTFLGDSFFKLKCDVLGANIVKSSSKTFAVYSVSVTDANNNSWSIKRRFRHFEELHRRLKEFPEYNLHLPPKHFLSTGLDVTVILERCKLLDTYLKKLLQLPTISGSIEVWDFLSVDSQTYMFSSAFSIVETLSVDLDDKPPENSLTICGISVDPFKFKREHVESENKESASRLNSNSSSGGLKLDTKGAIIPPVRTPVGGYKKPSEDSGTDSDSNAQDLAKTGKEKESQDLQQKRELSLDVAIDPSLPTEWVPPNLSAPILDLVDVIFQLQEGGWIRRKAFWVAKQLLQLGMGDALDDWLIEKIQVLRRGPTVASVIQRVEQILWPDGIFLTKHPKRRRPSLPGNLSVPGSPSQSSPHLQQTDKISSPREDEIKKLDEQLRLEADRRAKFVYEIMIDNAPAAVVGLIGRKEYDHSAKDLYFFIQSAVCLRQLMLDLVELVLSAVLPELENTIKQLHEEKEKFGQFRPN
ncbi:hypothetical protein Dimus_027745 [Dionaea muscipula]